MKNYCFCINILVLLLISNGYAQNVAITDDDGYIAHPSAMLDVKSLTKGFLTPRLTTVQRTVISSPATGLLVFDSDLNSYYFYNGAGWVNLTYGNPSNIWSLSGSNVFLTNTSHHVGVGSTAPVGKLEVKGDVPLSSDAPLFEVINSAGDTVFAVYSQGVRINVADDPAVKAAGSRSGFAVGGFSLTKGLTNEYLRVTPDSVRVYIEENAAKAAGSRGGFAVGGFSLTKPLTTDYFNISGESAVNDAVNSEPRILWYPLKEALLSGRVLVQSPDSIGTNSFASGFESKSIGDWSQALGYHARAYGDNSTAIGNYANATGYSSFAFGDSAVAKGMGAYAFGSVGRDTLTGFSTGNPALAVGDHSFAIGLGTKAEKIGAIAIGNNSTASGKYSVAFGVETTASGDYSTAMGKKTTASGNYSTTMGYETTASGYSSTTMGYETTASGDNSTATGYNSTATGYISTAMGMETMASGTGSIAMGLFTTASEEGSTVMSGGTTASGYSSTAMGYFSTASGGSSTAMGVLTIASGGSSTAMGYYTTAQPYASLAIGRYNIISGTYNSWVATDPLFIIGNGSGDAARSNAMTVLKNGNVGIGTTTPNCLLHVNAASGDIFRLQDNGTTRMKMIDNGKIMIGGNSTPSNTIDVDGNMSIGSYYGSSAPSNGLIVSGNVGIGTASPSSKFVVANGESNFYSGTYSDPAVGFVYDAKFGGSNNGIAVRGQSYFAGKVGIGTSSPANKLDVNGLIRAQGADWPATGAGVEIAYNGTGYIQSFDRGASSWKELRLGGNVTPVNDNLFSCGTSAYKWTAVWAVDGTINTSDLRLKKDIQKLDYGLSEVLKLEPVSFYWKQNDRGRKIGLIAQEVQNVIAEVVVVGEDPQKTLGLNYAELVPVLIKAIQEISAEMEETKTENKKEIEQLKTKIETLNALLQSSAKTK